MSDVMSLDAFLTDQEQLATKATKGPWTTGPDTLAGYVWVYAFGQPLCEPLYFLRRKMGRYGLFGVRSDSGKQWSPGEMVDARRDRFWRQKQADAAFIASARTSVPILVEIIRELTFIPKAADNPGTMCFGEKKNKQIADRILKEFSNV